jgi:hypothetical protein
MTREARQKAWATRRAKYGAKGHRGSYYRGPSDTEARLQRMTTAIVRLHVNGVLSEGQAARVTGLDRVAIRGRADAMKERIHEELECPK